MQDIDLRYVLALAISQWKKAAILTGAFVAVGFIVYFAFLPYQLRTQIVINDAQTSQLQAFTNNFFGLSKTAGPVRRNQTPSARAVEFLQRPESFTGFGKFLMAAAKNPATTEDARARLDILQKWIGIDFADENSSAKAIAGALQARIGLAATSPSELLVTVNGPSTERTHAVTIAYTEYSLEALKVLEEKEIEHVRNAIEKQRDHFQAQFMKINKEMITFQTRPDNVLSLASGENVGNYLSDLMIRKNEVELKITENERAIEFLGGKKAATLAATRDLGQRSQISQLIEATKLLHKQAIAIQDSINKFTKATSGSAEVIRMADELKKTSEREFKNFQEANDMLSKLGVYQISIANKFEALRFPELDEVRKAASLYVVLALALFLAQLLFAAYIFNLWVKEQRAAQAARDEEMRAGSAINIIALVRAPASTEVSPNPQPF